MPGLGLCNLNPISPVQYPAFMNAVAESPFVTPIF